MNRIFYILFEVFIVAIIVFINNSASNNENSIEIGVTEKDIALVAKTKNRPEPSVALEVDGKVNVTVDDTCIINKGVIQTTGCNKFKNIEKMNLSQYTNLKLHNDVLTMFLKGEEINIVNLGLSIFELGVSDQGKVYQLIMIPVNERGESEQLFFNSMINDYSKIVTKDEFNLEIFDTNHEGLLGAKGVRLYLNDDVPFKSYHEEFDRCLSSWQRDFLTENQVDISQLTQCDPIINYVELNEAISFGDGFDFTNFGEDVVLDGGGLVIRNGSFQSNVEHCLYDFKYILANSLEINPETIEVFDCHHIHSIKNEIMENFINVKEFLLQDGSMGAYDIENTNNLEFLSMYQNLERISIEAKLDFDFTLLNGKSNLKTLNLIDVDIINSENFDYSSVQLKEINLKKSRISNVDFLKEQYELEKIDLSYTQLNQMPKLGFTGSLLELNLRNNNLTSIAGFEEYNNIQSIDVSKNNIKIMSNLNLDLPSLESVNINFNPLDCDDPYLNYSPKVKSSCNRKLKDLSAQ